jgi:hypothetical protein
MVSRNGSCAFLLLAAAATAAACGSSEDSIFGGPGGTGAGTSATTGGQGGDGGNGGAATTSASTSTTSSTTSSTGTGTTCDDLGDPCTLCESTECADIYCNCYNNAQCGQLYECLLPCAPDDQDCQQACYTAHEDGISDGALLVHCAATVCATACPGYVPLMPCEECLFTECEAQMNTCGANPDCVALLGCLAECNTPGCENGCYALHAGGLGDAGPVGDCLQAGCAAACQ